MLLVPNTCVWQAMILSTHSAEANRFVEAQCLRSRHLSPLTIIHCYPNSTGASAVGTLQTIAGPSNGCRSFSGGAGFQLLKYSTNTRFCRPLENDMFQTRPIHQDRQCSGRIVVVHPGRMRVMDGSRA
jgi:hypothetical protein